MMPRAKTTTKGRTGVDRLLGQALGGKLWGEKGASVLPPESRSVVSDTKDLFAALIAEMPSDGALVRQMVGQLARHLAMAAYWAERASVYGLSSDEGRDADERATKHGYHAQILAHASHKLARERAAETSAMVRAADTEGPPAGPVTLDLDAIARDAEAATAARRSGSQAVKDSAVTVTAADVALPRGPLA